MDKFLERHKVPKLTQVETDYVNSPTSINEIEAIVNLPRKLQASLVNSTKQVKDNTNSTQTILKD